MEIELSRVFAAAPSDVWKLMLDPQKVAQCVPGMESVEVLSDTEYKARIKVKIAFISARFSLRVTITQMREPEFLRIETRGDDATVGSSVQAVSEVFLTPVDGGTELRVVSKATVLGRLGTLGLNPMRTKAERMWDEFARGFAALLAGEELPSAGEPVRQAASTQPTALRAVPEAPVQRGKLLQWFGRRGKSEDMRVEFERNGARVVITCPASQTDRCLAWLETQLSRQPG